jgi:hypothetical protein
MRTPSLWISLLCLALIISCTCSAQEQSDNKLHLVLPDVQFRATPLKQVIESIAQMSREVDPQKEGVNILLAEESLNPDKPITVNLRHPTVIRAIKLICSGADLNYRVENTMVIIEGTGIQQKQ